MANQATVIFVDDDAWQLGQSGSQGAIFVDIAPTAAAAREAIESSSAQRRVVLAVPSRWCLCASISTETLPRRGRRTAMLYRLEEKLPLAAEDVAADFLPHEGSALGVAVATHRIAPIVESLEAQGIVVEHVCSAVLLALQADPAQTASAVAWQSAGGGEIDLLLLREGRPAGWLSMEATAQELLLHLRLATAEADHPTTLATHALDPSLLRALSAEYAVESSDDRPPREAALAGAKLVLDGRQSPWIDLRGGVGSSVGAGQMRAPLTAALLAACLFLATLSAVMLWRAHRHGQVLDELQAAQADVFAEVFPEARIPLSANIGRRLEIEAQRLGGPATDAPESMSALTLLGQTLRNIPPDMRYRLFEVRLGPDEFYLEGETRTHGDADEIATALRALEAFDIEPPGTQQIDGQSVSFRINGVPGRSTVGFESVQ